MNIIRIPVICFWLGIIAVMPFTAWAKQNKQSNTEFERQVEYASELIEQQKYAEAKSLLENIGTNTELNDYQRAIVLFNHGYLNFQQGKAAEALPVFEQALKSKKLPDEFKAKTLIFLGLACKAQQQQCYVSSIREAEKLSAKSPALDVLNLLSELAEIEYAAQSYSKAAAYLERLMSAADQHKIPKKRMPQEKWLRLQADVYAKLENIEGSIDVMRQLALFYEDKASIAALLKYSGGMEPLLADPKDRQLIERANSETLQKALNEVKKARTLGNYANAKSLLEKVLQDRSLNPHERATAWNTMSNIRISSNTGLRTLEIYALEQAWRQSEISAELAESTIMSMATLYWVNGLYDVSIARAEQRLKIGPNLSAQFLICSSHLYSDRFTQAINACKELLAASEKQGQPVNEGYLRTLERAYEKSGDQPNQILIVKQLVKQFPGKGHDKRLAVLEASAKE